MSALLVAKFAPEAEGHGTDSAIEAVHTDPRAIRVRAIVVKMVSSALTIGSGGSAGREGPTAQISAGFGSLLTRRLDLSDEDGRIAVSLGIGSGIGAIFGAPLGGAVLAASIVYREDFDYRALIPGFITSATAYAVFGSFLGFEPLFGFVAADYPSTPAATGLVRGDRHRRGRRRLPVRPDVLRHGRAHPPAARRQGAQAGDRRSAGRPAGAGHPADPVQRLRLGADGRRPRTR